MGQTIGTFTCNGKRYRTNDTMTTNVLRDIAIDF